MGMQQDFAVVMDIWEKARWRSWSGGRYEEDNHLELYDLEEGKEMYAHQMIPLFNRDMTNQGIVLITTLINTCWATKTGWEYDKNLLKERTLCLD